MMLNEKQAYAAMYSFLEHWYSLTASDDIGNLLGSLSTLPDGATMDSALCSDWLAAVDRSVQGLVSTEVVLRRGV